MAITILYRTADGELFENFKDAQTHEEKNKNLTELYPELEAYDDEGKRIYVENTEAFQNDVWSIEFHDVEELNTLSNLIGAEQDISFTPYDERKGLFYVWDDNSCGFISLYDWFKNQASGMFPTEKIEKFFPY